MNTGIKEIKTAEEILYKHWEKWCRELFDEFEPTPENFKENMEHDFVLDAMEEYHSQFKNQGTGIKWVKASELKEINWPLCIRYDGGGAWYYATVCSMKDLNNHVSDINPIEEIQYLDEGNVDAETDLDKGWIIVDEKQFCKIVTAIRGKKIDYVKQLAQWIFSGEELLEFVNDFLSVHYSEKNKYVEKEQKKTKMKAKFNSSKNILEEIPEMKWPEEKDFGKYRVTYEAALKRYNDQELLCKTYPVGEQVFWKDGEIVEEGKDYELINGFGFATPKLKSVEKEQSEKEFLKKKIKSQSELIAAQIHEIDSHLTTNRELGEKLREEKGKIEKAIDVSDRKINESSKPKVICFCGSTRFVEWFMIKRWELEKQGIITFGINILPNNYFAEGNSHGAEQEGVKEVLDELHKRKIDLSDEVFVLNVGGYIGESTKSEIEYAESIGKPVNYLENEKVK